MNYVEYHLGDYAAATAHLSWDEDMAYMRLIRAYYHTEKPIPKDKAYRLARADTAQRKKAVDAVLSEFFTLKGDDYHQKRCDEEIARYQDKQIKAKQSANARWNKSQTHSDGNANASPDAMRTHSEGNAPRPRHQTPDTRHQSKTSAAALLPVGEKKPESAAAPVADAITARTFEIATLLQARGAAIHACDLNVSKWAEAGITDAHILAALETAQQRRADACSDQPIGSGYLNTIIIDPKVPAWWSSDERMSDMADELGIPDARPGESNAAFRARITAAMAMAKAAA